MPSTTPLHSPVADTPPPAPRLALPAGPARTQAYARLLTTMLLQPRRVHLKHRAPRDPRDHQLVRDIAREHAKPAEMILRVQQADLDDGAPLESVLRFHEAAIVLLREYAGARRVPLPPTAPIAPFMRIETRYQYRLDQAQLRALENQNDVDALEAVETEWSAYAEHGARMVDAIRQRRLELALARGGSC